MRPLHLSASILTLLPSCRISGRKTNIFHIVGACLGLSAQAVVAGLAPPPNIVYFLVDDLGRADLGFTGSKDILTPHIDKLAKGGAILDSFYVQPVCSPTRAALLTGRYATHTGVYTVIRPGAEWGLPLEERTLPQALRKAGYTTAITGKWHLGEFKPEYQPLSRGFDHQYGHFFGAIDYFTHQRDGKSDWFRNDKPLAEEGYSTHLVAKEACRLIRDKPPGKPLFLYVPFNGVHGPYQVPESYSKAYPHLSGVRKTMAGMLSAVDEAIGQITATLEEKGLRENTIILFYSDNGGPSPGKVTMNTPLRAGKGTIYEGGIRVCAFANWPGHIPVATIKEPIHAVDWYPTLLKLAGATSEQKLTPDGLDIWPVLTEGAKTPHDAILLIGTVPGKAAIRMGDWKLLRNPSEVDAEEAGDKSTSTSGVELYNLADDISESKNLAISNPEKVRELNARLNTMLKDAVKPGDPSGGKARKKKGAK